MRLTSLEDFCPKPGQRVIALSPACVDRAQGDVALTWPGLHALRQASLAHPGTLCWLALPADLDRSTTLAVCRAAHEVWLLEHELESTPLARELLQFRTESAPPCMGERLSVLYAPEVGRVRVWREANQTCVDTTPATDTDARAGELNRRLQTIATMLATHACANPGDWRQMAQTLRHHAEHLRHRVRASLAVLFVLTSLGMVGLQWLAMSGLNIPMADLYAVFFLWVGGIYLWGRKLHWNEAQLAWHALADALDIQGVLSSVGLKNHPITALYPLRHRRQIEWVREALRPMTWTAYRFHPSACTGARALLTTWVPQARQQHQAKARQQTKKAQWLERGMKACYAISALLTVLVMADGVGTPFASLAVNAGIGLTSSMGTLMLIFNGVLGFAQDAALHGHLSDVFEHAQHALAHGMSEHEYEELLVDLGRECVHISAERTLL